MLWFPCLDPCGFTISIGMQCFSQIISFRNFGYNIVHAMDEEDTVVFFSAWSLIISLISNSIAEMASFQMAMTIQQQSQSHLQLALNQQKRKVIKRPSFWVFPRPSDSWLEHTLHDERIPEKEFKRRLRVTKATFSMLVRIFHRNITRHNPVSLENAFPQRKLWLLICRD